MSLNHSSNRSLEETLSALMDGEVDDLELRRLLKHVPADQSLAEMWRRLHLASSIVHHEDIRPVSAEATRKIFDALELESAYPARQFRPAAVSLMQTWVGGVGRFAIAASVSLAVFVALQGALHDSLPDSNIAGSDGAPLPPGGLVHVDSEDRSNLAFDAEAQQRLNEYIRSVSIQYSDDEGEVPQVNVLEDSQLIRQVNQIEN